MTRVAVILVALLLVSASPVTKLQRCMVYLPNVHDAKLRHWCLKQSERMP